MVEKRTYYQLLTPWIVLYLIGITIAPLALSRFNLTAAKTHLVLLSFAIPQIIIWIVATRGAQRFKCYTNKIKDHKDGKSFDLVASGLVLLVINVVSLGLSQMVRPWALQYHFLSVWTIAFNYLEVLIPLLAFSYIYLGTRDLLKLTAKKQPETRSWALVLIVVGSIAVIYSKKIFNYQFRNDTPNPNQFNSFYLPDPIILLTIALPYLTGWALGIKAAINIMLYGKSVEGTIYKNSLYKLSMGIVLAITFGVFVELFFAFSTYIAKARLQSIYIFVFLLLAIFGLAFQLISAGSKKLQIIEEAANGKD